MFFISPFSHSPLSESHSPQRVSALRFFRRGRAGFTLIEMMVVVSIMVVITGVILLNHGRFNSAVLLRALAYQVAITLRQAQAYGVGVREIEQGSSDFSAGYGLYFSGNATCDGASASATSYFMFADKNKDGRCSASDGDKVVNTYTLSSGYVINTFCATTAAGVEKCAPAAITDLVISYKRPNPEAVFLTNIGSDTYGSARITLSAPNGATRTITVGTAGEISVEQYAP